jgi:hypothetical protein
VEGWPFAAVCVTGEAAGARNGGRVDVGVRPRAGSSDGTAGMRLTAWCRAGDGTERALTVPLDIGTAAAEIIGSGIRGVAAGAAAAGPAPLSSGIEAAAPFQSAGSLPS